MRRDKLLHSKSRIRIRLLPLFPQEVWIASGQRAFLVLENAWQPHRTPPERILETPSALGYVPIRIAADAIPRTRQVCATTQPSRFNHGRMAVFFGSDRQFTHPIMAPNCVVRLIVPIFHVSPERLSCYPGRSSPRTIPGLLRHYPCAEAGSLASRVDSAIYDHSRSRTRSLLVFPKMFFREKLVCFPTPTPARLAELNS